MATPRRNAEILELGYALGSGSAPVAVEPGMT